MSADNRDVIELLMKHPKIDLDIEYRAIANYLQTK